METANGPPTTFGADPATFDDVSPHETAKMIAAASDVAVVLDHRGVVRDLAVSDDDLPREVFADWVGRSFADTMTIESRPKLERMREGARNAKPSRPVQINHLREGGEDLPVRYRATAIGDKRWIALGRDMSPVATAQQRVLRAQRTADREHAKLRASEMRFRQYFQHAEEPVLFVDPADRITDANQTAVAEWAVNGRIIGRRLVDLVAPAHRAAIAASAQDARQRNRTTTAAHRNGHFIFAPLRQNEGGLLVRFVDPGRQGSKPRDKLARIIEAMPDAFVITDARFIVLTANAAFVAMTAMLSADHVEGASLERWLGRSGVDLPIIRSALSDRGVVRGYATQIQGDLGEVLEVEVSAAKVEHLADDYVGLSIRQSSVPEAVLAPRSAQHLADLVGRVPLKEIVRETTDTIERLCIESALELSGDNRASAAELLGLSRQSLYVKMRRYGIAEPDNGEPSAV